jgi:hypothetical protein
LEVPHPDFIVVSPKGSFVIVVDSKERPHHLNSLLIERASPLNGQRRRRRRGEFVTAGMRRLLLVLPLLSLLLARTEAEAPLNRPTFFL